MNNQYLEYLKKEMSNHLSKMIDLDGQKNYYPNQEKQHIKSVEIDNFFDLYLNTLNLTPKILATELGGIYSKLVNILYSTQYQKFEQRKSWLDTFKEEIKNNTENLFFLSFEECLNNHGSYLSNDYENPDIKEYYVKENFDLFKDLVRIGKEKSYFKNKDENYFHTSNKLYKDYLEQENIFNPQFDFIQLKKELTQAGGSKMRQKYVDTYIGNILEFFQNNPDTIEELSKKKLLDILVGHISITQDPEVKKIQTDFFDRMISNPLIRASICNSSLKNFLANFPSLLETFVNKFEDSEKSQLFNNFSYGYKDLNRTSYGGSSISNFIGFMINNSNPIDLNLANIIIDNLITYNKDLSKQDLKEYVSSIVMHFTEKLINHPSTSQSTENIIFINKYLPYLKEIPMDNDSNNKFSKKIFQIEKLLEYTQNSYPETHKKMNIIFKNKFESFIVETWNTDKQLMNEKIIDISSLLKNFSNYELLESINKNDLNFKEVYKYEIRLLNQRSKEIPDFPLIFGLFEKNPEIVLSWLLKTDNIDKTKEIKYKSKNIVEYFADSKHINLIIEHLTKDENAFKKLILDNKKVFKKLANHENEALKIATNYHSMSIKLEEKEVDSIKRKI